MKGRGGEEGGSRRRKWRGEQSEIYRERKQWRLQSKQTLEKRGEKDHQYFSHFYLKMGFWHIAKISDGSDVFPLRAETAFREIDWID